MTKYAIETTVRNRTEPATVRVNEDDKKPGHVFMSSPHYHTMTPSQAIELATALADIVEDMR